jgi:hypothetical protein
MENKAPRTDRTRADRQAKRRAALDEIAQALGFASWSAYETAMIAKHKTQPPE